MRSGTSIILLVAASIGFAQPKMGVRPDEVIDAMKAVKAPILIDVPELDLNVIDLDGLKITDRTQLNGMATVLNRTLVEQEGCYIMHRLGRAQIRHQDVPRPLQGGSANWMKSL